MIKSCSGVYPTRRAIRFTCRNRRLTGGVLAALASDWSTLLLGGVVLGDGLAVTICKLAKA